MTQHRPTDLVVVLPGITGSTLYRDGKAIWKPSAGAILHALVTLGGSLRSLTLPEGSATTTRETGSKQAPSSMMSTPSRGSGPRSRATTCSSRASSRWATVGPRQTPRATSCRCPTTGACPIASPPRGWPRPSSASSTAGAPRAGAIRPPRSSSSATQWEASSPAAMQPPTAATTSARSSRSGHRCGAR